MTTENLGRVVGFSILSGAGVPSGGLGDNGDSYLNSTNGDVYLKTGGVWGSPTGNIRGIQGAQGFSILSGAGAPTTQGVDGDSYLNTTNGDTYLKSSGIWSLNGNIKGIQGDKPTINTNSTTSNTIATGAKTFTLTVPLDLTVGQIAKAYSLADPNNYMCGFITSLSPFTINVSEIGGSGTKTDWVIALSGFQGKQGITTTNMTTANRLLGKGAGQSVPSSPAELEPVGFTLTADKVYNAKQSGTAGTPTNIISAFNVEGGKLALNTTVTGAIKIKPFSNVNSFYVIKGIIRSYGHIYDFTIEFNPSILSLQPSAKISTSSGIELTVRMFSNGSAPYITIGETTTLWDYLSVSILSVTNSSYNAILDNTANGWEVSLITTFTGTQEVIFIKNRPYSNLNQIVSDYVAASGIDTPLTNAMSIVQMLQNLDKSRDNRYTKTQSDARYLPTSEKGANNGVATLDSGGKIPSSQLPDLAITDTFAVASQAAMLALTAQVGDIAIRSDISKTFILRVEPATTLSNWSELLNPTNAVTSVAGKTGVVTLVKADVGLSNVDNTADSSKPVSTAQQTALDLKANLASPTFTGTPSLPTGTTGVTQTVGDNSTKLATTAYVKTAVDAIGGVTVLKGSTTMNATEAYTTKYKDTTVVGATVGDCVVINDYIKNNGGGQTYILHGRIIATNTLRIYTAQITISNYVIPAQDPSSTAWTINYTIIK